MLTFFIRTNTQRLESTVGESSKKVVQKKKEILKRKVINDVFVGGVI